MPFAKESVIYRNLTSFNNIFKGLALISMGISLMQEQLMAKVSKLGSKLQTVSKCINYSHTYLHRSNKILM